MRVAMNQIGWEMRHSLPNSKYVDFVATWLLSQEGMGKTARRVDPFAINVPAEKLDDVYVFRPDAERLVSLRGNRFIVGPRGCGKTTLFRILPKILKMQPTSTRYGAYRRSTPLVVGITSDQISKSAYVARDGEGKIALLGSRSLSDLIFKAYWEDLFRNRHNFLWFYPILRRNGWWRDQLHRFYHEHCPVNSTLSDEPELMTWLAGSHSPDTVGYGVNQHPTAHLKELLQFVSYETEGVRPYAGVVLAIDTGRVQPRFTIGRLTHDVQRLHDLNLADFELRVFVEDRWQDEFLETMNCVVQGQMTLTPLPRWTYPDLRDLLHRRLKHYQPRIADNSDYPWGKEVSADYLVPAAQTYFVDAIVRAALYVYQRQDIQTTDASIHVLSLARALIAACAGTWSNQGIVPPLTPELIDNLVAIYWDQGQEKSRGPDKEPSF